MHDRAWPCVSGSVAGAPGSCGSRTATCRSAPRRPGAASRRTGTRTAPRPSTPAVRWRPGGVPRPRGGPLARTAPGSGAAARGTAGEVPFADPGRAGEPGRGQVAVQVGGDLGHHVADDGVLRRWRGDVHAHLRLDARPLQVGDQLARHLPGQLGAVVLLDEGEGQVQRAGDPCGRGDRPVPDGDRVGVDEHVRVVPGQPAGEVPVGRGAPPAEQTRGGQDRGPGADGGDASALPRQPADVRHQDGIGRGAPVPVAAGDDEGVERPPHVLERPLDLEDQTRLAGHGPAPGATRWTRYPGAAPRRFATSRVEVTLAMSSSSARS